MAKISESFTALTSNKYLVEQYSFDNGEDGVPYFNFTFYTLQASSLWLLIQERLYKSGELGPHMAATSMAMCTGKDGWNDYLLLFHFDPKEKTEEISTLE